MRFWEVPTRKKMKKPCPSLPCNLPDNNSVLMGWLTSLTFKRRDAVVLQLGKCICCQSHGPINFWKHGEIFPFKATIPCLFTFLDIYHSPLCCFLVTKSCLSFCHPTDCSPPVFSFQETSQARILEWVAISFSRATSQPRDRTQVSCIGRWIFYHWATREAPTLLFALHQFMGKTRG